MAPNRAKGYHGLGYRDDQCYYQTQILILYFPLYILQTWVDRNCICLYYLEIYFMRTQVV